MKKLLSICFLWCFISASTNAQSTFAPINTDISHLVERYEIKSGALFNKQHTHIKPYQRKALALMADTLHKDSLVLLSKTDKFNLQYLQNDNWEWSDTVNNANSDSKKPFLKKLYKKKSDFFQFQNDAFDVHVSPVAQLSIGKDSKYSSFTYLNTRGIELRGMIDRKVGFYAYITDNQARFPLYVQQQITAIDAVPNEGYYKDGDRPTPDNVDFITARGYITFNATKHIQAQFGHDRNFIGNGQRSMILSDFSSPYLFLKVNTNIWKLNYQNIFAQMTADVLNADGLRPKKYFAFHHLSANITKNFNIGLFESVVFGRGDSLSGGSFDFNYLNPLIFYRSVEQNLGSPDNAIVGLDFKWNFKRSFSFYGQLVLDEFRIKDVIAGNGWWGNKQAWQLGFKYIDVFGLKNLDFQLEMNTARPYTYTQDTKIKSYTNYNQALAHPLGANFREFISVLRYQPIPRLTIVGKIIYAKTGADTPKIVGVTPTTTNWGTNLLLSNKNIEQEYGNTIGQGVAQKLLFADLTLSYQLKHNLFVDFKQVFRRIESDLEANKTSISFTQLSIRLNIASRVHEF